VEEAVELGPLEVPDPDREDAAEVDPDLAEDKEAEDAEAEEEEAEETEAEDAAAVFWYPRSDTGQRSED